MLREVVPGSGLDSPHVDTLVSASTENVHPWPFTLLVLSQPCVRLGGVDPPRVQAVWAGGDRTLILDLGELCEYVELPDSHASDFLALYRATRSRMHARQSR